VPLSTLRPPISPPPFFSTPISHSQARRGGVAPHPAGRCAWGGPASSPCLGVAGARSDPLPDHLAFQLRESGQNMQEKARHGVCLVGVDVLGHRQGGRRFRSHTPRRTRISISSAASINPHSSPWFRSANTFSKQHEPCWRLPRGVSIQCASICCRAARTISEAPPTWCFAMWRHTQ